MHIMTMTSANFADKLRQVDTAILPIGMIEAHGRHCPLGTDMLIPRKFLEYVEAELGDQVFIAPEVPYGHSRELAPFAGTINLPPQVFGEYVYHIGAELARWGIKKLVLFNGHGGNIPALQTVMGRLADLGVAVMLINWWLDFKDEILLVCDGQGHGGEDETSAVLAIDEDLVDMDKAGVNWAKTVVSACWPGMERETLPAGMSGDATRATREKGEELYKKIAPRLLDLIMRLQKGDLVE